jgi:hypothetical protein
MEEIIEKTETTFEKGIGLEKEFATFLKTDLGWEKTRTRSQMASVFNARGTNVDIIAERIDKRGKILANLGKLYIVVCALFIIIGIYIATDDSEVGLALIVFGIFLEICGFVALHYSNKLNVENAWVECKNTKVKTTISQVQKTIDEVAHYNATSNKEYKFEQIYFVSANGFIENALKKAIDNKIICYTKDNGIFKKVDYWNH